MEIKQVQVKNKQALLAQDLGNKIQAGALREDELLKQKNKLPAPTFSSLKRISETRFPYFSRLEKMSETRFPYFLEGGRK